MDILRAVWPEVFSVFLILLPLALTGFFYLVFTPSKETARIEKDLRERIETVDEERKEELAKLEKSIFRKLDEIHNAFERYQERQENRMATLEQLNGATARLDERIDDLKERVVDAETQAQLAFNMAQASSTGVDHLTKRLEEVIGNAINRLEKEIEKLSDAINKRGV